MINKPTIGVDFVLFDAEDDDAMLDYWLQSQPILTEDESLQEIERLNKNAGIILKMGLSPNLDSIY